MKRVMTWRIGAVGLTYGSNSSLVPAYPNEWELFARGRPLQEEAGDVIDPLARGGARQQGAQKVVEICAKDVLRRHLAHGCCLSQALSPRRLAGRLFSLVRAHVSGHAHPLRQR